MDDNILEPTGEVRLPMSVRADFPDVRGSGGLMGGSSKGGSSSAASQKSDANNTLRSNAKARLVEVLGEGEIVGLVNGAKSIFFDATALQNSDGTYNFTGVTWQERKGQPEQEMLTGMPATETTYSVGVEVKHAQEPPIRTISDINATSVRIICTIPSLVIQDQKTGSLLPTDMDYVIERRRNGGAWEQVKRELFQQQKTTSPYQHASVIDLPAGGHPYSIRVRKVTGDPNVEWHQSSLIWESFTAIVEGRFTYPNTALIAMELDASNFGSSIPARYYDVKGLIIQVPSNYDPENRTYDGFWDGTFKRAWTNNPAWVFYDLLTNSRYGLGEFIDGSKIDKYGLYEIAMWCDQPVDDGRDSKEPRYTFNGVINSRDEAFKVLQQITASFRGMAFWSVGQVFAVADMPGDPVKLLSLANVVGGAFKYSRTAKKTRNTVAMVSWNDPDDFYRNAIEVVQHDEGLEKYGWRQTDIQAVGCTSRGLANRIGRWTLDTEHTATETVEFEMSLEALAADPIRPGHIIAVADPRKAQVRIGGRVISVAFSRINLDRPFEPLPGSTYRISVIAADGTVVSRDIAGFEQNNQTAVVSGGLPEILPGAMWTIGGTDVNPRQYRVLSVSEPKKNTFKIAALFHDPLKYARVEEGIILDPIRYTRPRSKIKPPTNLKAVERQYFSDGIPRTEVLLSWTPGDDWLSTSYAVYLVGPGGDVDMGTTTAPSMSLRDLSIGGWTAYVTAQGVGNARSEPASLSFNVSGWDGTAGPIITNLRVRNPAQSPLANTDKDRPALGTGIFLGKDCTIDWDVTWPEGVAPYPIDFVVRVFEIETRELLSDWIAPTQTYTYYFDDNVADGGPRRKFWIQVRARDAIGREGSPGSIVCNNPAPEMIIPDVETTTESIFVGYDIPLDQDWAGGLVWLEREQGYDPLTTAPRYDGPNTLINLKALKETYYYLRFAAYDLFSKTGLNISPEIRVYVTNHIIDVDAPEIPTNVLLQTEPETAEDGTVTAVIRAIWDPNPSPNFKGHEIEIREKPLNPDDLNAWVRDRTTDPVWEKHGLKPATTYEVRVRAFNGSDIVSGWSVIVEIVAAKNELPPDPVTDLKVENAFQTAILTWTDPKQRDLDFVEIWAGDTAETKEKDLKLLGQSTRGVQMFFDKTLSVTQERYYWARTVNTSSTQSKVFVGPVRAVSPVIQKEELASAIIDQTSFADGLTAIGVKDGLPEPEGYDGPLVVINRQDGKLYQLKDGKWILVVSEVKVEDIVGKITDDMLAEIDAAKVVGQLTDDQIASLAANKLIGKVVADQIEALGVNQLIGQLKDSQLQAISAAKVLGQLTDAQLAAISTAKLVGQVVDSQIAAVGAGKLTGQITGTQIADNSITTPKVVAGSINADRLVAASITTTQIQARTIVATDIAVGTLTGTEIAAQSITGTNIAGRTITAGNLVAGTITAGELAANSVTATQIAANSVAAYAIVAGSVTADKIAVRSVSADKIVANTLTSNEIAANTIVGGNIAGRTITGAHVVANSLTAGEIAAKTIVAWNIAAGTITGAEIQAGSVNADRLVANSITTGQIAAGAIKTDQLAAGAITADKIGVGLTSGNWFFNSDFQASVAGFIGIGYSDGVTPDQGWRTDWAPQGMGSAMVHRGGNPTNRQYADFVLHRRKQTGWDNSYPVTPGQRYEFSSYVSVHRARAQVILVWIDANGGWFASVVSGEQGDYQSNGPLEKWARVGAFGFAPDGATRVIPLCRTIWTGESEPYVFWTGLYLGKALANQTAFTPWSLNSSTVIDGGTIATNSLSADRIVAGSITADRIMAGTITGDRIAANTITGGNIQANSIYADRIQIGGGASLTSWLSGPNNTQLNGGSIATNSITANKIRIGSRGIQTVGLDFSVAKDTRVLSWSTGYILYIDDNGASVAAQVPAGAFQTSGGYSYVWWCKRTPGALYAARDNWADILADPDNVLMCAYDGWAGLNPLYGGTIIDGTRINTGTITAQQIVAGAIQTGHLAAGSIIAEKIAAGQVTADKIGAGTINAGTIYLGSPRFWLDSASRMMRIFGYTGMEHVSIGNIGRFYGQGDDGDYGAIFRDVNGNTVMKIAPTGTFINGAFINAASIGSAQIANAQITNAHIQDGQITSAKIGAAQITSAHIGYLEVDQANIRRGAVSQAGAASAGGARCDIGVVARDPDSRIFLSGIINNNPNIARGSSAGITQIWWFPGGNEGARVLLSAVATSMWVDKNFFTYWGTTPAMATVNPGQGYHVFSIQADGGQGDNAFLSFIELSR